MAINYCDCILLICLRPFRDYQATVVEIIASCTNSAYVTLLSLPVVVSASSYAGDDICLIEDAGKPPCWRTLEESCKGLGSVSLRINNQHTHTPESGSKKDFRVTASLKT